MKTQQTHDINGKEIANDIWITRADDIRHINTKLGDAICPVCEKKRRLKAHHVVPKRLKVKSLLKELRFKICDKCHNKIHPESILIIMMRKMIDIIDELTDGKGESMEVVRKFKELAYNSKNGRGVPYGQLERINEALNRGLK